MRNTWENKSPQSKENTKDSCNVAGEVDWLHELQRAELGSYRSADSGSMQGSHFNWISPPSSGVMQILSSMSMKVCKQDLDDPLVRESAGKKLNLSDLEGSFQLLAAMIL